VENFMSGGMKNVDFFGFLYQKIEQFGEGMDI